MDDVTRINSRTGQIEPIETKPSVSDLPRGVGIKSIAVFEKTCYGVGDDSRMYTWNGTYTVWKLLR
jgi:hypothetical protein